MPEDLNLVNKLYYGDNLFIMRQFEFRVACIISASSSSC